LIVVVVLIKVPPREGMLVVNLGEMLQVLAEEI
jgi:isopenicillin N synthase-like dioxygenase